MPTTSFAALKQQNRHLKIHSHRTKAKVFFDVCRLLFIHVFSLLPPTTVVAGR